MSPDRPRTTEPQVPARAEAVVDLLNSRPYASMTDKLDDPGRAADVLRPFGHRAGTPSAEQVELVRALRSDLIAVLGAPDAAAAERAWTAFTAATSSVTFQHEFSGAGQVGLHQVSGDAVAARIVLDVADLVSTGTWNRLRMCANDRCTEVFYDTTRSRTRRWHSYEICGNRTNVAAYRARARSDAAGTA
jgi:predicted RNA-binding Zn ribbon-like protein